MIGKSILRSKIKYLIIGIVITTSGTVFFFPVTIDGRYTCVFHRIFDHSHPVSNVVNGEGVHIHSEVNNQSDNSHSLNTDRNINRETESKINHTTHGSVLLDKYLETYAFLWWLSVGLLALSIFMWLNLNKKIKIKQSEIATH